MDAEEDKLRAETKAKLRALWEKPGGPDKVRRLMDLELKKRARDRAEANRLILMAVLTQSLKIQTLTEQAILRAKATLRRSTRPATASRGSKFGSKSAESDG